HFTENIFFVRAPGTDLEIFQLPFQVPISLSAQFRRVQRGIPLRLQTMTGSTHRIEWLACGSIAGDLSRGLRERRIAAQPRLKSALFLHHDAATHDKVPSAA